MVQQQLFKALISAVCLIVIMALTGILLESEIRAFTTAVVDRLGFMGLAAILMVTDTLVMPFPPDVLLALIVKSPLSESWPLYVGILGMVSVGAGMMGYGIGRWLGHFRWCQRLFGAFKEEYRQFILRYGFWGVALGSATPFPYSVTCWTAGVLGIPATKVLVAALMFRVPRFYFYYWLLSTSGSLLSNA